MSQTWKKSGGIKQFDAMNNITVNSITTDEFAMRTPYKGTFTISGELYVFDDASFNKNVKISSNEYVEKNIYLRQKLVMGKEWERTDGAREDSYRNFFISDQSGVGLNIENPNAVLDICGTSQNILHVYSSADKTSNILARNKNHHRIALEVDNSNTQIVFTHHHSDVEDVSSAIVFEPTTEQIRFPKQVAITSVLKPSTASLVVASNSLNEKPFLNSIYDVSSKSVPLHVHSLDVSGIAMAFFSNNQDKGWYFGGGNYPKDPTRQMGLMGWQDPSGTFLPSQIQVTTGNNNLIKNRITTGINTYMPLTEDYVLDINGPLKIHHQEIREALRSNFTIHSVSFSKKNPLFGLAVGKENVIRDNISYNTIHRTTDSGITWDSTDISFGIGSSGQAQETTLGVFAFDMSNAVIVSKGAEVLHIFRTNTQGVQWSKDVSPDFFDNKPTASTLKPYAIDFSNILLGETDISCNEIKFFSYSSSSPTNVIGTMNPNRQITSMDGYMDLYGNATILTADTSGCIYKYTYTQSNDTFTYGPNQHYNLGSPYLFITSSEVNDYVLACGNNIISVKTFYDVSFTDISFDNQSLVFNHAVVRDLSHAIVVGNDGVIYYARNDIREKSNWNRVTEDMVRGMGNAELIIHNTRQLTHVHSTDNSCNFIFTYGSRLVHAYLPDLWFPEDSPPLISIDGHIETTRQSIHVFENHVETIHIGRYAKDTLIDMCGNVHVNNSFHHNIHSNHVHIQKGGAGIFLDDISSSEPFLYKNDVPPPNLNTALYDISNTVSLNGTIWIKGNLVVDGSTNIINDNFDVKTGQSIVLKGTLQPTMHVSFLDFSNCDNDFKGSGFYISNNRTTDADSGTAHFCVSHEGFMKVSNEHIDKLSFRSIGHHNVVALDFSNIQTYTPQFNSLLVLNQHNIPNVLSDVSDNFYIRSSHCDNTTIDVSARMLNIFDLSVNKNVDIFGKEFVAGDVSFNSQLAVGKHVQFYHTLDVEDDVSFHDNVYVDGDIVIGNRDNQGLGYKSSRITFNSGVTDSGDFARLEYFDDSRDISFLRYGSDFFDRSSSLLDVSSSCLLIHTMKSGDGSNNDNMIIRAAANMVLDTGAYIIGDVPTASNRPTNAGDILILPNGGNLGVGKINPNAVLDVSGDVSFNSQLAVGKHVQFYHTLDVEDDVSFHDNVYVDGDIVIGNRDNQGLGYKSSRITFNSGVTDSGDFARLEYFDDISGSSDVLKSLRYGGNFYDSTSAKSSCLLISTANNGHGNDNMIIRPAAHLVIDTGVYTGGTSITSSGGGGQIMIFPNGGSNKKVSIGKPSDDDESYSMQPGLQPILDVSGDVHFENSLYVQGDFIIKGALKSQAQLEVTGDVTFINMTVSGETTLNGLTTSNNSILLCKKTDDADSKIEFQSKINSTDKATIQYFDSTTKKPFLQYGPDFSGSANNSCLAISSYVDGQNISGGDNILIRPASKLVLDTGYYSSSSVEAPSRTNRSSGGDILILPNGGRLGIGRNDPKTNLDVSGDISFNGKLYVRDNIGLGMQPTVDHKLSVAGGDVSFSNSLFVGGNATIQGNFTIQGTTTTINSTVQTIKDPVIILGEGSADLSSGWRDDYFDRGLMFKLTDTSYGFMGYDRSMSAFRFVNNITTEVSSNRVQSSDYSKEGTLFAKSYTCNDNSGIAQIVLYGSNTDGTAYSTWNGITTRKTAQVYNVANSTLNHVFMYGCENITNTNDISGGVIVTEIASTGMSIYGNVFVKNDVSFNSKLYVGSDVSFNSKLFVKGDVSFNAKLYVNSDVSFAKGLTVNSDASFGGVLTVSNKSNFYNDVSLSKYLFVGSDVSFNSKLFVKGDVSFNAKLYVNSDVSFAKGLTVNSDASFGGVLTVSNKSIFYNDVSLSKSLFVGSDVSFNSKLFVKEDVSFNAKLYVNSDVSFAKGLTVNSDASFGGVLTVSNKSNFYNDVSLSKYLFVGSDVSFNSKLFVKEDVSFGSGLAVTGRSTFNNDISLNRYLFVGNDVSLNKRLYVGSDVSLNAKLYVNGDVSFGAGVDIAGNFRVAGGGTVNLDSSGGVHVSGLISGGLALNKLVYNSTIMNKANWLSNLIYYHTGSDGINSVSTGYTSSNSIVDIFNLHSIMIFGYFSVSSDVTYNIHISIYSTRLLFWFGSNARTGYYTYANSRIKLDRTENLNTSGYTTISMKAGKKYPIRILKSSETLNDTSIGFKYSSNTSNNDGPWQNFDFSNFYYSPFPGYSPSPDVSVLKIDGGQRVDDLYVSGNLMLTDGGDLTVIGGGDVSFGGGLTVTGRSTFNNDISLSNYLFVGNDVSLNTRLYVGGNVSLNTKLYVNGDVSFGSGLTVTNRSTFNNDISLSRYLFVGNDVSLNTRLYVGGDVSFNQKLKVSGDVSFNAGLTVKGVSDFSGVTIKSVLKLEGGPVTDDVNVESSNKTNTYIRFGAAGSADDWVYLRQIGTSDNIQLALDFHDNSGDAGFVIRDISSAGNGADSSFNERFKVKRGGGVVINGTLDVNGGAVTVIGDVTATSFNATSDYRMKENVEKLSFAECSVENLNPVSYILKTNKQPHIGFLAHELQEYFPTAVSGVKDGEAMQTVNYLELIPVLVKEIQELKKKVLFLENDIDYLKQELSGF